LRHQHPIKRIVMVPWQPAGCERVAHRDWQPLEPVLLKGGLGVTQNRPLMVT
jgi:hypothetical protein